jgi:hypothetical protein
LAGTRQHPKADPAVPDQDQIEEGGDRQRLDWIEMQQGQMLGHLVQRQDHDRQGKTDDEAHR